MPSSFFPVSLVHPLFRNCVNWSVIFSAFLVIMEIDCCSPSSLTIGRPFEAPFLCCPGHVKCYLESLLCCRRLWTRLLVSETWCSLWSGRSSFGLVSVLNPLYSPLPLFPFISSFIRLTFWHDRLMGKFSNCLSLKSHSLIICLLVVTAQLSSLHSWCRF